MDKYLRQVTIPEGQKGSYKIEKKVFERDPIQAYRMACNGRTYVPGTYTFLFRDGTLVMSDTPDEMRDHIPAVYNAEGHCLIAGLGIGMVLEAILRKPEVTKVTVVEISEEVIELVADHYNKLYPGKIEFIQADILEWNPPEEAAYGMVWFDIWDTICSENLEDIQMLHEKFLNYAAWSGAWSEDLISDWGD